MLHYDRLRHCALISTALGLALMIGAAPAVARPDIGGVAYERLPAAGPTAHPVHTIYHVVAKGETLWTIARMYRLTVAQLSDLNGDPDPRALKPGQCLALADGGTAATPRVADLVKLLWPLHGTLTSLFGPRWGKLHTGIDIATSYGSEIHAALGGIVGTAAWLRGYGRTIILDHGNGYSTLYAHASKLLVEKGAQVTPGEVIAKVGSTGNSTGPHVHFEVRIGGKCVDPLRMLE